MKLQLVPLPLYICRIVIAAMWNAVKISLFVFMWLAQSTACCLCLSSCTLFIVPAFCCSTNFIFPQSLSLSLFESLAFTTSDILPSQYISCQTQTFLQQEVGLSVLVTVVDITQILYGFAPYFQLSDFFFSCFHYELLSCMHFKSALEMFQERTNTVNVLTDPNNGNKLLYPFCFSPSNLGTDFHYWRTVLGAQWHFGKANRQIGNRSLIWIPQRDWGRKFKREKEGLVRYSRTHNTEASKVVIKTDNGFAGQKKFQCSNVGKHCCKNAWHFFVLLK